MTASHLCLSRVYEGRNSQRLPWIWKALALPLMPTPKMKYLCMKIRRDKEPINQKKLPTLFFIQNGRGRFYRLLCENFAVSRLHMPHRIASFNAPWKTQGKAQYRSGTRKGRFGYTTYRVTSPHLLCGCWPRYIRSTFSQSPSD